jgi:outer membrane protein OmpA-like peptidoglycan-associated protein
MRSSRKAVRRGLRAALAGAGAGLLCLAPTLAGAEPVPQGVYFGAGGGLNLNDSGDLRDGGTTRDLDTDLGFVGLGSAGYAFGNGFRAEVEGGYRRNAVDNWGGAGLDGHLDAWHAMVNALYDFQTGSAFTPYMGAGVGAAFVTVDAENRRAGVRLDDSDVGLAYQAIVGMSYDMVDNLAVTADYRFFHALDIDGGDADRVSDTYMNHAFVLGLRYAFGGGATPDQAVADMAVPASAPVAVPAPVVPTSYLVFFDFDSARLTPEAASIVDTAASNALSVGKTRIEVTGHTDRVGAAAYNMVLSQRRADAVMERLIAQGIARNQIAVLARGEDEPLMPTADGVREPQNRRVEIILM